MAVRDIVQAAAGVGGGANPYIEDVFSTYLYTGNGSTQTITNGIDLAGEGGLVWTKGRNVAESHNLVDTERGVENNLRSNSTGGQFNLGSGYSVTAFNSDGYDIGLFSEVNQNTKTYASWTFRKAPKFFDCVTYTGNGVAGRTVAHNLGSVPGCMIVKKTNTTGGWSVYHRSLAITQIVELHSTGAAYTYDQWNSTAPSATEFTLSADSQVNGSGNTYVAYLFAHDAGGFGDDGEQNVISCGNYTGAGTVNLGFEPQWVLYKRTESTGPWYMNDTMRGFPVSGNQAFLYANASDAESSGGGLINLTSTGFTHINAGSYIYIAIRRGPMKTPTSGTEVFNPDVYIGNGTNITRTTGFPQDMILGGRRDNPQSFSRYPGIFSRLQGHGNWMFTSSTTEETSFAGLYSPDFGSDTGTTNIPTESAETNSSGVSHYMHYFRRAPGFFDVVCYTCPGNASQHTYNHNLGVTPELVIIKKRNEASTDGWWVCTKFTETTLYQGLLNSNVSGSSNVLYSSSSIFKGANSTQFTTGAYQDVAGTNKTHIAYLFATLAGVSKVGSYTGTGTTLQVDCGFSAGARFVLIKRTDSTGDWYVWDSARGISSSSDPYILLNSTAADVTGTDYIDPLASGFEISSSAPAAINASGGNFIFLAIA